MDEVKVKFRQIMLVLGEEDNESNWITGHFFQVVSQSDRFSVLQLEPRSSEERLLRAHARHDLKTASVAVGWPLVAVIEAESEASFSLLVPSSYTVGWAKVEPRLDHLCEAVLWRKHGPRRC